MPLQIPAPPIAHPLCSTNQGLVSSTAQKPNLPLLFCLHSDFSPFRENEKQEPETNKLSEDKKKETCALLTHLVVRFIVHFRVSERERRVRATGEA